MNFDWSKIVRWFGAGLASICTFLFGAPDIWLKTLLAFFAIDYFSGVAAAWVHQNLNSKVGFIGILKKTMYFFVVAVAHCVDVATGAGGVLQDLSIGFLIANEGISILENCAKCGIPIPARLIKALAQIKGEGGKTEK